MQRAREQFGRMHHKLGSSPLILWLIGVLVLVLWACGTVTQIQTSEFLAQGSNTQLTGVSWSVFMQPWLLITGQAPIGESTAWMYGWVVEALTLVFALAVTAAVVGLASVNRLLAKVFVIAGVVLVILNSVADYSGAASNNPLVRFLVALALGLIVTCGLPVALALIEKGFEEYA